MASKTKKRASMPSTKKTAIKKKAFAKAKASPTPRRVANVKAHARAKAKSVPPKVFIKKPEARRVSGRDGTGHLDSTYAAELHAMSLASAEDHTVDRAFLRVSTTLRAPLADELGREAVMTMTSAEDQSDQLQDVELELGEEIGGPFVPTTGGQEFAGGRDRSNPRGATREPFPKT